MIVARHELPFTHYKQLRDHKFETFTRSLKIQISAGYTTTVLSNEYKHNISQYHMGYQFLGERKVLGTYINI